MEQLRICVVGAGFMGTLHARAISECSTTELSGIVDPSPAAATALAEQYGAHVHSSVGAAIADGSSDAYVVAVPDRMHVAVTVELLRSGAAILLEKPMADTLAGARTIWSAARSSGTRLMVGHILRFDPRYVAAAAAVAEGSIGEVLHTRAGRFTSRAIGTRLAGHSSVLLYLGVHDADALQWITGAAATEVYAAGVSKLMCSESIAGEDAIFSVVKMSDGSIAQLFSGWTDSDPSPVTVDGRLEVYGTSGSIEIDVRNSGVAIRNSNTVMFPDCAHWPAINDLLAGDLVREIDHFARAVMSGSEFIVPVEAALRAVALNDAIFRSVHDGAPAEVETIELVV